MLQSAASDRTPVWQALFIERLANVNSGFVPPMSRKVSDHIGGTRHDPA